MPAPLTWCSCGPAPLCADTYLSVSFIQMLKALMPAAVFMCGLAWVRLAEASHSDRLLFARRCRDSVKTHPLRGDPTQGVEKKDFTTMAIMAVVTMGIMIASYGACAPPTSAAHLAATPTLRQLRQRPVARPCRPPPSRLCPHPPDNPQASSCS